MNYIKHLAGFFDRVATDERLNPTHVSMYVSLFQFWNANRFQNPISISRNELMKVSKISAKATYHKCMKELNEWQYLKYKPSYNPFKGSLVYLFNFQTGEIEKNEPPNLFSNSTGSEQAVVTHHTKIETSIEQAQEPYINSIKHNKQNIVNLDKQAKKSTVQKLNGLGKKEKSSVKKERNIIPSPSGSIVPPDGGIRRGLGEGLDESPTLQQIQEYFTSQKFPSIEAEKFYNYFQSNGWLVGGRTKMKDWQAAANNWMINAKKFADKKTTNLKAKQLHTRQNKNYNEPL